MPRGRPKLEESEKPFIRKEYTKASHKTIEKSIMDTKRERIENAYRKIYFLANPDAKSLRDGNTTLMNKIIDEVCDLL